MKQRKLFWVLVIAVVLVWGLVAYRFYDAVATADDALVAKVSTTRSDTGGTSVRQFVYKRDVRDPFEFSLKGEMRVTKANVKAPQPPPWAPPPFHLTGILESKRKKTITLEEPNGVSYFLIPGDTLRGLKIVSVSDTSVTYVFNKRRSTWSLPLRNP